MQRRLPPRRFAREPPSWWRENGAIWVVEGSCNQYSKAKILIMYGLRTNYSGQKTRRRFRFADKATPSAANALVHAPHQLVQNPQSLPVDCTIPASGAGKRLNVSFGVSPIADGARAGACGVACGVARHTKKISRNCAVPGDLIIFAVATGVFEMGEKRSESEHFTAYLSVARPLAKDLYLKDCQ